MTLSPTREGDTTCLSSTSTQGKALSARSATVMFGGFTALSDVSLTIPSGTVVGLIGPNGAGKTTCVNVLTGFQVPTSGDLETNTIRLTGKDAASMRTEGIARTFQAGRLFTGLDVLDNLAVTGVGLGHSRKEAEQEAHRILQWMGADHLSNHPADSLPYTDERRISIARALMFEPDYLLLDEPAAGMSEIEAAELDSLISRIAEEMGTGILLIEHNVGLVLNVSSYIYVLDAGKIIDHGVPDHIRQSQTVREAYLGSQASSPSLQEAG